MLRHALFVRAAAAALLMLATWTAPVRAADWELAPSMPAPKSNAFAVTFNGAIYMVGGSPWVNGNDKDGSVYKFANEAWSAVATLEGMGPAVGQGGGVDALNRIMVFGGVIEGSGDLAEPRAYDPVNGTYFTPADASIYHPAQNFGLAVDGSKRIYRLGGGCDNCGFNHGICSRYDGTTDSWQEVAYLPYSRSSIASTYDGQGHIWGFGGYTSYGFSRIYDTIKYTVATNTWETKGSLFLPVQTSDSKAVLGADGRVYVIGGNIGPVSAGVITPTVYVLDQSGFEPTLTIGPSLNIERYDFGVTLGSDGFIYVIGGMTNSGPTATVERLYTGAAPVTWSDLGLAKAGTGGTPHLVGSGPLTAGSANQINLTSAKPSATATLVFGTTTLNAPFKGGTLVPSPLVVVPLATNAAGTMTLPFTWPAGVRPGLTATFQFWIQDAGASNGLSASNGLQGLTP